MSSLADSLRTARHEANRQAAHALTREIGNLKQRIDVSFADLDPHVVEEAIRPIDVMAPTGDLEEYPAATSLARIDSVRARAIDAAAQLEEVRAQGQLARLDVSSLVPEPIVDETMLSAALGLIRESVEASWAAGKSQVRLL
jgi:hypothetical protein